MISAGSHQVDLSQDQNLLLAGGSYSSAGNLGYHNENKLASAEPVSLALVTSVGGSSDLFFRLHGLLMVCAWIGCAGVGMILARYFKNTWRGKQLGGKDLWFVFHRSLMVLTVLLSITAVVLIVVEVDVQPLALSNLKNNAHPVIGLTCVILAILLNFSKFFETETVTFCLDFTACGCGYHSKMYVRPTKLRLSQVKQRR